MATFETQRISQWGKDTWKEYDQALISEEPLLIRIEGHPYVVLMRTPGDEIFHAAGFCLTEGLIEERNHFTTIGYCSEALDNTVNVSLHPARAKKVSGLLNRQGFISQTSCGICGKEMIEDIHQEVIPIMEQTRISIDQACKCIQQLEQTQELFVKTHAAHAAILLDAELEMLSAAEDVGRHNALDKAIGKALMGVTLSRARIAVLSSRLSYEMVQKAARARIPIVIGISRPTAMAVKLGDTLNMTLISIDKHTNIRVYCHKTRVVPHS